MEIKIFKKQKNFRKGGFHTNPDICWEIVLYIAFAIVAGALVFGLFLFKQIDESFVISDSSSHVQATVVNKDRLDRALQYFSVRQEKSNQILNSSSPIVDPSL